MKPQGAHCDDDRLHVSLSDGRTVSAPLWWYPRLLKAEAEERSAIELLPRGIRWPLLDEDISVDSILRGEKAVGARDPLAARFDGSFNLSELKPLPADWESKPGSWIDGAHQRIDYRSLIHGRVWRTYGVKEVSGFNYKKFFAAADTLLDVSNILHVAETEIWPQDQTVGQLWMYGALQALAVQQDAMEQLLECFEHNVRSDTALSLQTVNDLRVSAVGHPQDHSSKKLLYRGCTFLAHRCASSLSRFEIVTYPREGGWVKREVDVPELIGTQQIAVQMNLGEVWNRIKSDPQYELPICDGINK